MLRGLQDTRTPLVVLVAANLANIVLNVVLVYGPAWAWPARHSAPRSRRPRRPRRLTAAVVRAARRHGAPLRPHPAGVLVAARLPASRCSSAR